MYRKASSFFTAYVTLLLIAAASGKVYNQCTPESGHTKIFTAPNNTRVTQIKWFREWGPAGTGDFLLVATFGRLHMIRMAPVRKWQHKVARHSETLVFGSDPDAATSYWKHILGFCPKNQLGRVRLNGDNKLEVCGSVCGKPVCRFYGRDQFDSEGGEDSEFASEVNYLNSEFVFAPRHQGYSWMETEKIGNEKTFVAMDAWLYKKDVLYKDTGSSDPERRYKSTQNRRFDKKSRMDFKKIVDREGSKKVLLFFNELSPFDQITGESVETRHAKVAQVCKNDDGAEFYSYLTLPVHCSIGEGEDKLRFRKLVAVSDPVRVELGANGLEDVVFATMGVTYARLNGTGSVVTMIRLSDVEDYFDNGDFMEKEYVDVNKSKNGRPVTNYHVTHGWESKKFNLKPFQLKTDRPGNCQDFTNSDEKEKFVSKVNRFFERRETRRNMYGSLKTSEPLAQASFGEVFTSVAAVSKKGGAEIIVGSSRGKVIRIYATLTGEMKSFVQEEIEIPKMEKCRSSGGCSIGNLMTVPEDKPDHIVASFDDKVLIQPMDLCPWSSWDRLACESHFACKWEPSLDGDGKCKRINDLKAAFEKSVGKQIELCKYS